MTFFELNEPLLPPNPETVGMQDLNGIAKAHLNKINRRTVGQLSKHLRAILPSANFSELDQAFIVWGTIAGAIFLLAQFSTLSWTTQALVDAALTGLGITGTAKLTWRLACNERLRWVVCLWAVLMMSGMIATAYGIFCGVGIILANLCLLWVGLCAAGYLAMGAGLRSRCFTAASLVHGLAMLAIERHPSSQFITSGLIMTLTLFFFSVVPWDMRATQAEELCGMKPAHRN